MVPHFRRFCNAVYLNFAENVPIMPFMNLFGRGLALLFLCFAVFGTPLCGQSRGPSARDQAKTLAATIYADMREAIKDGIHNNANTVASLLEKGADPNGIYDDKDEITFLMRAVNVGHYRPEVSKLLLDYGADPNIRDVYGNSAAYYVGTYYKYESHIDVHEELLRLLAAKGARFDITNDQGESPLMRYIRNGNPIATIIFFLDWEEANSPGFAAAFPNRQEYYTAILGEIIGHSLGWKDDDVFPLAERLLKSGADPNGRYSRSSHRPGGVTFLMRAMYRHQRTAGLLLDYGADIEARDEEGRTAAFFCASNEQMAFLLSRGIRLDVTDKKGMSPLMHFFYRAERAFFIFEWEEQHSPDFSAGFENRKDYFTRILSLVLGDEYLDNSPPMPTLIERLIDGGADLLEIQPNGILLAYLAVRSMGRSQYIIPLLIERGAPVDSFNRYGDTLLYTAVVAKNVELVQYLLNKGADPNQPCRSGKTALLTAYHERERIERLEIITQRNEIVRLLLNSGADPNKVDSDGETALMKTRNRDIAELLLSVGADPTVKDSQGQTVLHRWTRFSFLDGPLIDALISRGCTIDEPDLEGTTPLMLAATHDTAVVAMLEKGADPHLRDSQRRTALHYYLLGMLDRNNHDYREGNYESVIAALLAAGARPADTDSKGISALSIAIILSNEYEEMIPLRDMMMAHSSADEIKIAQATASKTVARAKARERAYEFEYKWEEYIRPALVAFSVPLVVGGLSIGMREGVYAQDPLQNWMGPVNVVLGTTMLGVSLGYTLMAIALGNTSGSGGTLAVAGLADLLFLVGGIGLGAGVGLTAGMTLAAIPGVRDFVNKVPTLYYAPTAISAIAATVFVVKLSY
jgi:ankyrin repeat protein